MPKTFIFTGLSSREVYDRTQTDDAIEDGDVLVVPKNDSEGHDGLVGFLFQAWPVVVKEFGGGERRHDHQLHHAADIQALLAEHREYQASYDRAMAMSSFSMPHCETCYCEMPWPVQKCWHCVGREST